MKSKSQSKASGVQVLLNQLILLISQRQVRKNIDELPLLSKQRHEYKNSDDLSLAPLPSFCAADMSCHSTSKMVAGSVHFLLKIVLQFQPYLIQIFHGTKKENYLVLS